MTAAKKTTAANAPATEALKTVETIVEAGKANFEQAVKQGTDAAQKGYEQAVNMMQDNAAKASDQVFKGYDEMVAFNKQNVDAYVEAGNVVQKAVEDLSKEATSFAQSATDKAVAHTKALMGCKTFAEVVQLQNTFAKESFDTYVQQSSKVSELSMKAANDAFAPIKGRMSAAAEKFGKPAA
ncbi:MAG: phasin family protein [Alphaproteobacteria bacterium]|nr:phasin family protein [Alphaproteobacteria bacterium]